MLFRSLHADCTNTDKLPQLPLPVRRVCADGFAALQYGIRSAGFWHTSLAIPFLRRWIASLRLETTGIWFRDLAALIARGLHLRLPPIQSEGAGKTGSLLPPRSRVRFAQTKGITSIQGSGGVPAFPAQWLYDLLRALLGERLFASVA
jgi:hypothetical protein